MDAAARADMPAQLVQIGHSPAHSARTWSSVVSTTSGPKSASPARLHGVQRQAGILGDPLIGPPPPVGLGRAVIAVFQQHIERDDGRGCRGEGGGEAGFMTFSGGLARSRRRAAGPPPSASAA